MGVFIKSASEIAKIRDAARIVAGALDFIEGRIEAGISTKELETLLDGFIRREGGCAAFKGYRGFPAAACISVNEEVVHGIPDARKVFDGDIVKIDVGVKKEGFYADGAKSFTLGTVDGRIQKLLQVSAEALTLGIKKATAGNRVSDISHAIESHVHKFGFSVVKELAGHGVGLELHEEPQIPNFGPPGTGMLLRAGMTICIEPMVNLGSERVRTLKNGWTVVTADGLASAHFEHTVLVGENGAEILTRLN
jgi:methionyl aminopeptidase